MKVELQISGYVPRTVIWTKRFLKGILLGCLGAVVILFTVELLAVRELRAQCDRIEQEAVEYEYLVGEGDAACVGGEVRLGEQYYLTALQINRTKPELYLKLAQIYREYRCYDLALQILEEYPGENEEIATAAGEVRDEIARLEVSVFQEMEK